MSIWEFANPVRFMRLSGRLLPYFAVLTAITLIPALVWGFFFTPDDYRQGATIKIIYVHVPTAFLAINIYFMMFVTSLIWLIRRHHVSALAAKAAAPVGAIMTLIALITGAVWGQPIWGTWWVWDPRLTSFLIMFIFYVGYIALWAAIDEPEKAADLTSILCMIGSVFAIVSRYAVDFWNQGLHQGTSAPLLRPGAENQMAPVFWQPLMLSLAGFFLLFLTLLLLRTRTEIRNRRITALRAREA
ncbi:MAG: heme ABC transporter permease CcmC [Rhodobacteraceae bacterium]|nr:heme ABC transporter permease CcmC [Paracoccaceae bacterium]